jgi:hypothetical protein
MWCAVSVSRARPRLSFKHAMRVCQINARGAVYHDEGWHTMRHASGSTAGRAVILSALCLFCHLSCEVKTPAVAPRAGAEAGDSSNPPLPLTLRLSPPPLTASELTLGWAAEVREVASGRWVSRARLGGAALEEVTLPPLPEGEYEITLFLERVSVAEPLPRYHPCPSPPSPRDAISLEGVDVVVGSWRGLISAERLAEQLRAPRDQGALMNTSEVTLSRLTCGPGTPSTALIGEVVSPPNLPLRLWLEALDAEAEVPRAVFDLTLLPASAPARGGEGAALHRFELTQLPAGSYSATLFEDSDADGRLTPCAPATPLTLDPPSALALELRGRPAEGEGARDLSALLLSPPISMSVGADTQVSETRAVRIDKGLIATLGDPLTLRPVEGCADLAPLTEANERTRVPLSGRLQLTEELLEALYTSGGALWVAAGEPSALRLRSGVRLMSLEELTLSGGRFTLLTPPDLGARLTPLWIWLDQGGDGRLIPCDDPTDPGTDLRWWRGDALALTVEPTQAELTPLTLTRRCDAPAAVIGGEVVVNLSVEGWAPRPLILSRENLFTGEITRSPLGWLSVEALEGSARFERRVPPGAYAYSAYLDQDLDGLPTPCGAQRLGDQFTTSDELIVNALEGETRGDLTLRFTASPCPQPNTTAIIELEQAARLISREGRCPAGHILTTLESAGARIIERCVPWDDAGALRLSGLYAGPHRLRLCLSSAPQLTPIEGCERPELLTGEAWLDLTEGPTAPLKVSLSPSCSCL